MDDPRLTLRARELVLDSGNDLYLSVASIWEMAIKSSLGKLVLRVSLAELVKSQCEALVTRLLPVVYEHAVAVENLEFHHRDPFDRLLVAQATCEELTLLSGDGKFDAYGVTRVWD